VKPPPTQIRVRYYDTDQMGVVYYGNYLRFFETARAEWIRAHGISYRELEAQGIIIPVIEAHVRYRQPARYDDLIDIATTARAIGRARVEFAYAIRRAGAGPLLAEGTTVHAFLDRDGRPRRMPDLIHRWVGGKDDGP
jgi:acyl-CoA thioester hydrolase